MKFLAKIPYLFVAVLAWIVIISSCANQGMPTGGPKDTIPPILVETHPELRALNYKEDEVRLTFNEYVVPDQISEILVISPPLEKRPTIRTKSKTLIVQFNEELKDSTTYSLDFKNSVADNNEKNPIENLRFSFSTSDVYDSLRVAGRVINAFNLEPLEDGSLVMLHKNLHDSAVFKVRPSYIAKTDETGLFLIDNIAPGKYHLFALNDANADLMYNEGAEEIAFVDSVIIPTAEYQEDLDTLVQGADSLLITGHTHFHPDPFYLRIFNEDIFDQYMESDDRETRYKCTFIFNESVADTFAIDLVNTEATDWYLLEPNANMDSITMWITDTIVANMDTLLMQISYFQLDSASQLYVQKDTLQLNFSDKDLDSSRRKRKSKEEEDKPKPAPQFNWQTNISGSTVELNSILRIISPEPIRTVDSSKIMLYLSEDTLNTPLNIRFEKDSFAYRTYNVIYDWEPETSYVLKIDSAFAENIYGVTSREIIKKFKTREEDYYGSIPINFTEVTSPMLVQLLSNDDNEKVLQHKGFREDQTVVFDFLSPGKYRIKIIYDDNDNGKWDEGSYQDKFQPERVAYINEVIKVRSNWENIQEWKLNPDPTFSKNIIDKELEEQRRKEALEAAKREQEQQNNPRQQQGSSNMFGNGSGGGTNFRQQ